MKFEEEIRKSIVDAWPKGPKNINWTKEDGVTGLVRLAEKHGQKNPLDPANNILNKSTVRSAMTRDEWEDDKKYLYWKEGKTHCARCGKKLKYEERMNLHCADCKKIIDARA